MKKVILSATCVVLIGLGIYSCKKEVIGQNVTNSEISKEAETDNSNDKLLLQNFVNPYEFVGEIHNLVLDEVLLKPNYLSLTIEQRSDIIANRLIFEFENRGLAINYNSVVLTDELKTLVENIPNDKEIWKYILDGSNKNEQLIIKDFKLEIENYYIHQNISLTISNMKRLENLANNMQTLKNEEKVFVLSFLALGRNTFSFWRDKYINSGTILGGDDRTPYARDISGFVHGWRKARKVGGSFSDAWDSGVYWSDEYSARP